MKIRLFSRYINHIYLSLWAIALPLVSGATEFPVLRGAHYQIHCAEQSAPTATTTPEFSKKDGKAYELRYEDTAYDLRQAAGFSGYFALDRWQKKHGDSGVDVTGAPNVALVEGADATLVRLMDQLPIALSIDAPAEGYVRFDWRKIGGSYFSLQVNAAGQRFEMEMGRNGYYISPLLRAGDQLQITFTRMGDDAETTEILLNSFSFYSNAVEVIARRWQAESAGKTLASFTQYISVEPINLEQVYFPEDFQETETGVIFQPEALIPEITGFPYLDTDGDQTTVDDRRYLRTSDCAFEVTWEDEIVLEEDRWTVMRRWRITDLVYRNVIERTQMIILYADALEEHPSEEISDDATQRAHTVLRARPVIQYLDWEAPED